MRNAQPTREPWMDGYDESGPQAERRRAPRPPAAIEPIMVPADEARRLLGGIDAKTLLTWRNAGHLEGTWTKIGGRVLFDLEALRYWSNATCARDCFDFDIEA